MNQHQPPPLTIVMLGKTGVGKSASGNTILGRRAFESKLTLRPVTKRISEETGYVFGQQISVIDTPGILDTRETKTEIKDFCRDLLQSSGRCLFLVVVRVGRFTKEDQRAVRAAQEVIGSQGMRNTYLLFTGGDFLKDMTLEDFIFGDEEEATLPGVVKMFGGAYHVFNNDDDDEEQVRQLLLKSGHLSPLLLPGPAADVSRDRRIVLLGLPGAGKSSSGNTILRSEKFTTGFGFGSVSTETVSESATVEGRQVTVVDTPGFTDAVLTPEKLYLEIMKSVVEASPGPHAFVFVVRIGRNSAADIRLFEILPKLFQGDASKYSMVLFTHGDDLAGQTMESLIRSNKHVSDLVSMCGGRYCVFDNKTKKSREQIRSFLNRVDEMVSANGGEHYTDDMFRMAETFIMEESRKNADKTGPSDQSCSNDSSETVWEKIRPYVLIGAGVVVGALAGIGLVSAVAYFAGSAGACAAGGAVASAGACAAGGAGACAAGGAVASAGACAAGGAVASAGACAAGGAVASAAGGAVASAGACAVASAAGGAAGGAVASAAACAAGSVVASATGGAVASTGVYVAGGVVGGVVGGGIGYKLGKR